MDERLRRLAREAREAPDDPAQAGRLLRERLRAGDVAPGDLELLARLGHAAAREALGLGPQEEPLELEPWLEVLAGAEAPVRARAAAALVWDAPLEAERFDGPADEVVAALDALDACLRAPDDPTLREALATAVTTGVERAWGWRAMSVLEGIDGVRALLGEPWEARGHLGRVADALLRTGHLAQLETAAREDLEELLLERRDPVEVRGARLGLRVGAVPGIVRALAPSRDGARLLVAYRGGAARLLSLADGATLAELTHAEAREVWAAAELPGPGVQGGAPGPAVQGGAPGPGIPGLSGGGWITGDDAGALTLWDAGGALLERIANAHQEVRFLELLPGGDRVLTGGGEGELAVWNLYSRREVWRAKEHPRAVSGLAVSPDRALALSGDGDGTLLRWDPARGVVTGRASLPTGVSALAFVDPTQVVVAGDRLVEVWDAAALERRRALPDVPGSVYDLAVSPDGALLATVGGSRSGAVRLWDLASGAVRRDAISHATPLATAFLPHGRGFLVGARTGALKRWVV